MRSRTGAASSSASRFTTSTMRSLLSGPPARDLGDGLAKGRYSFRPEQMQSVLAFVGSITLAAMWLVLDGEKTWREAGSDAAELMLCSIGVAAEEAQGARRQQISRRFPRREGREQCARTTTRDP